MTEISLTTNESDPLDPIMLLFALGGETLAFYEIRKLASILHKYVEDYPEWDEDILRKALSEHEDISTSNGNYFTWERDDDTLPQLGIRFFSDENHVPVMMHIANQLPYAGSENGAANWHRLARDMRNSLFAKDIRYHILCYETERREFPQEAANNGAYSFLTRHDYSDWIRELSPEMLSVCVRQMIPTCLHDLSKVQPLLEIAMPRLHELHNTARFPMVDLLIMAGRFEEAEKLAGEFTSHFDTVQTRLAWLDFVHGHNDAAIEKYMDALESIRTPSYGNDFYFQTITGIFFIFALIKRNNPMSLGTASVNARLGVKNALYRKSYTAFQAFLNKMQRGIPVPEEVLITQDIDFETLVLGLITYWDQDGQLEHEQTEILTQVADKAESAGLLWIANEARELISRCQEDWIPDVQAFTEHESSHLVDCMQILPSWTQNLNEISEIMNDYTGSRVSRTEWIVSFMPECRTQVNLELFEQHLTKTDKWSKGKRFDMEKLLRDLHNNGSWPSFFTAQDIQAAYMLLYSRVAGDMPFIVGGQTFNLNEIETFSHNDVLPVLQGHPRLYWSEDHDKTPVQIIMDEPYVQIASEKNGKIVVSIYPQIAPHSHLSAVRFEDDSLHLFCFQEIHQQLARELGAGLVIPEAASDRLTGVCQKLAQILRIKSDYDLSQLAVAETMVVPAHAVLRLERRATGLNVELLFKPFGEAEALQRIGEGKLAILECHNGMLMKKLRDTEGEKALAERLLNDCHSINDTNMYEPYRWLIENSEGIYQFMLQIRSVLEYCQILWKQDRKLTMTRIGFGDVKMRAQRSTNWLEVDGDIVINEELTLSFQKLLELAKQQKGNFIQLSDDGQILELSKKFRDMLDTMNNIGQEDRKGQLQFSPLSLPALQIMLGQFDNLELADGWLEQAHKIDEARDMEIPLPTGFSEGTVLRDYQQEGFRWLTRLDHWGAGACLADDMGLGKTIQAIAFILSKTHEGPALVVAPTSACMNWVEELAKFAPSLETVIFGQGNREEMLKTMKPGMVMISSYGLLQSQIACFAQATWRVVVLDEAQFIKNYQAKRSQAALKLNAQFKIATTGTPIENNLGELWTLFQFITPGLFGKRQNFQERFIGHDLDSDQHERLNALIKPFMLRRVKEEVLTQLPPKTEIELRVELSPEERAFYEAVRLNQLEAINTQMNQENTSEVKKSSMILAALTTMRQAACNPMLIEPGTKVQSAKMEAFKQLISDLVASGHRTLVFSQYVKHLDLIRPVLTEMNITYDYLDGSTPNSERPKIIQNFQNGNANVFLISLKAGGTGINLTRADYVILLDPWWNPAVERQAMDRAHRIGQTRPVTIYRIIAKDTIEDRIIKLHKQKEDLAEKLLAGSDVSNSLSAEELLRLLQET